MTTLPGSPSPERPADDPPRLGIEIRGGSADVRGGPDEHTVLTATGELDLVSHLTLLAEVDRLLGAGHRWLVLDLGAVSFCDSTGLAALVRVHRQTTEHGGWLRVATPGGDLRRMLEITNLDRLLDVYDSVADAAGDASRDRAADSP